MKMLWSMVAVTGLVASLLIGAPTAWAKESDVPAALTLFNDLKAPAAKWSYDTEVDDLYLVPALVTAQHITLKFYATPDGKHYYFGVARLPDRHLLFIANETVFDSLDKWRAYIHDRSDYELIGASLGVYSGPITVTVQKASGPQ